MDETIAGWDRYHWARAVQWLLDGSFHEKALPEPNISGAADLQSRWQADNIGEVAPDSSILTCARAVRWAESLFSCAEVIAPVSNIKALPGCRAPTSEPNQALVAALRDLLGMAEDGRLQSFIGTGFFADGSRAAAWVDHHPNVYEMLGALAWLQAEYINRHEN